MKTRNKLLIGIFALLPAGVMAESFLTEKDVTYRGNQIAQRFCQAVVNDDVKRLEYLLKQLKRDTLYAYAFDERSDAVVGSVTCNDMELLTFADEIGAGNISAYLGEGNVTIEEVVVIGRR